MIFVCLHFYIHIKYHVHSSLFIDQNLPAWNRWLVETGRICWDFGTTRTMLTIEVPPTARKLKSSALIKVASAAWLQKKWAWNVCQKRCIKAQGWLFSRSVETCQDYHFDVHSYRYKKCDLLKIGTNELRWYPKQHGHGLFLTFRFF